MYNSYSVFGCDYCGRRKGRDFETRVEADDYFNQTIRSGRVVSITLYGWTAEGNCNRLRRWSAGPRGEDVTVHIDTDNEDWGRVCSDGTVLDDFGDMLLVEVETIRATILVPREDVTF